jgi:selenocysteine lyase/cysteine desulfurase
MSIATAAVNSSRVPIAPRSTPSVRLVRCVGLPLPVVGAELVVPLVSGERARYVNLDYAASAPCLQSVQDAVNSLMPWYSSVHRGAGFASTVSTEVHAAARASVAAFVGARRSDSVIFTRNTTDALNLLASSLPEGTEVVTFGSEHHANLLPWRRHACTHLPIPSSREEAVARADFALRSLTSRHRLLAVTGASNVTGEVWPLEELAEIAHRHGARLAIDAAQLAPHRAIDMAALGADYIALSGHKLYAPFGSGALIGRGDWLDAAQPYLAGGGAVRHVTLDDVEWADGPARHEGGTPNLVGEAALAAACSALMNVGMARVAAHEGALTARLVGALRSLGGVEVLSMWGGVDRVGVVTFNVRGVHPSALAAALSAEHGIGVRDGAFCAHPLMSKLAPGRPDESGCRTSGGALRVSFGVGTSDDDIDHLIHALRWLTVHGPKWTYALEDGRYVPTPDPRPRPELHPDIALGRSSSHVVPAPCRVML